MPVLERIEVPQAMDIRVDGPDGANHLFILGGTGVFHWNHSSRDTWEGWIHDRLRIPMLGIPGAPEILEDQVVQHMEAAHLASFSFSETIKSDCWGFAVDSTEAFFTRDPEVSFKEFGMWVDLAMRGFRVNMCRVGFCMHVLARL